MDKALLQHYLSLKYDEASDELTQLLMEMGMLLLQDLPNVERETLDGVTDILYNIETLATEEEL